MTSGVCRLRFCVVREQAENERFESLAVGSGEMCACPPDDFLHVDGADVAHALARVELHAVKGQGESETGGDEAQQPL